MSLNKTESSSNNEIKRQYIDVGGLTKEQVEMLKSFDEYIINSAIAADPTGAQVDTSTLYTYYDQMEDANQ